MAGLAVEEVPLGVTAVAGVTVNGTDVLICCLDKFCVEGEGDGQHLLPFGNVGDEVEVGIAEGAISVEAEPTIHWKVQRSMEVLLPSGRQGRNMSSLSVVDEEV